MRGDHFVETHDERGVRGLPPRARGSQRRVGRCRRPGRPTPACAGITPPPRSRRGRARAYPRVRGDHHVARAQRDAAVGLPPRARGSLLPIRQKHQRQGPTPACAGITTRGSTRRCPTAAYPRVRGDHFGVYGLAVPSAGLPPRARGSPGARRCRGRRRRPTPACAGITLRPRRGSRAGRGLPPRARGSLSIPGGGGSIRRPTPACAGITRSCSDSTRASRAYPRVRGDHRAAWLRRPGASGLPPRARGSPHEVCMVHRRLRPTPACAGITAAKDAGEERLKAYPRVRGDHRRTRRPPNPNQAYPRVRGDHSKDMRTLASTTGLPPRARGSHPRRQSESREERPTPACAGITTACESKRSTWPAYPRVRGDHVVASQ